LSLKLIKDRLILNFELQKYIYIFGLLNNINFIKMKKLSFLIFCLTFSSFAFCQSDGNSAFSSDAQWVGLSYGFFTPYKTYVSASAGSGIAAGSVSFTLKSMGPIGLSYEKGVSDKISVGGKLIFGSVTGKENISVSVPGASASYNSNLKLNYFAILFRGNYHFGNSTKFDPYGGLGLGYGNFKISADGSDGQGTNVNVSASVPSATAFNVQLGCNYYVTDNIGINAEVGFLGSFLQLGVVTKF